MVKTRNQLVVDLYRKGETYQKIGNKFKISRTRVYQILKKELRWKWLDAGLKSLPSEIKKRVFERGPFKCYSCGKKEDLVISRLTFHREGKKVKLNDLEILCFDCNIKKYGKHDKKRTRKIL